MAWIVRLANGANLISTRSETETEAIDKAVGMKYVTPERRRKMDRVAEARAKSLNRKRNKRWEKALEEGAVCVEVDG